jgi:hypothetical protein
MYKVYNPITEKRKKSKSDPCWKGYKQYGTKKKDGKEVPNCIPVKKSKIKEEVTSFMKLFGDALKNVDDNAPIYHSMMPNFREINLQKIKKYLKDIGNNLLSKALEGFSSVEEVNEHLYYHGTTNYIPHQSLKPGAVVKGAKLGGGYEDALHTISLTKSKKVASIFQGNSRSVEIHEVLLLKGSRIIDMEGIIKDSNELEDYLVELWDYKVDGVWIGGGEQELAILNPKCITMVDSKNYYMGASNRDPISEEKNIIPFLIKKIKDLESRIKSGKSVNPKALETYKRYV